MKTFTTVLIAAVGLSTILLAAAVTLAATLLWGCATADPPTIQNGCAVDLRKLCQSIIDENLDQGGLITSVDGVQLSRQRLQNVSVRHMEFLFPSHGGAQLRCVVDTQTARVSDGHISSGPQLSDADLAWVREKGLCQ
jgi:hypothetical protein